MQLVEMLESKRVRVGGVVAAETVDACLSIEMEGEGEDEDERGRGKEGERESRRASATLL